MGKKISNTTIKSINIVFPKEIFRYLFTENLGNIKKTKSQNTGSEVVLSLKTSFSL